MKIFSQIVEIFLLGLIGGAVPGPMLTAVFTEVLKGGFKKSFRVIFRALLAESSVAILILLLVFALNIPSAYFQIVSIAGAIFLIWLATKLWKIDRVEGENREIFTFFKIFILTILSGAFWIFWITVCVPKAFALRADIMGGQFIFLATFEFGWLVATASLAFIFSRLRPWLLRRDLVAIVFKIFALILIFFAVKAIATSFWFFVK
ncbi:MAG: LysE family transporter [Candidatus Buchananbacteria bacterium]